MMHKQACCCDEAANHQLPLTVAFWIIWIVSAEECSRLMQKLLQICCSTHSVILNVMATQYTCSLNGVYCPHWLVQWSPHCSTMCIPVYSPWLPGYINVAHTVLVILTMAGIFLDIPCMNDPQTWTKVWGLTVGVGSGLGGGGQKGKNWDNCNSIDNKIFKLTNKIKFKTMKMKKIWRLLNGGKDVDQLSNIADISVKWYNHFVKLSVSTNS